MAYVMVLGGILAVLGSFWLGGSANEDGGPVVRVASGLPEEIGLRASERPALAISPDGQRLVFVGLQGESRQLYQRLLSQFEWQPIAGTEGAEEPFFSPDGEWIAFFADDKLKKVSLAGMANGMAGVAGPSTVLDRSSGSASLADSSAMTLAPNRQCAISPDADSRQCSPAGNL